MKKSVKKIEIGWRLWSLIMISLAVLGIAGFSYAYESSNPSVMGHTLSEIQLPECNEGQILVYDSSKNLVCSEINSQLVLGAFTLGNTSGGSAFKTYCPKGTVAVGLDFKDRSDDHSGSKLVCSNLSI